MRKYREIVQAFKDETLHVDRMVAHFSKTLYNKNNPTHKTCYNANVFGEGLGKIWYGDLDLTLDSEKLQRIADRMERTLYVLSEGQGKWHNESRKDYADVAVSKYVPRKTNDHL